LRRANTAEGQDWILQPVLPRQDFFTKEIHRLLRGGGKWSQSPVLPRTKRAYETCLSAGSTAMLAPSKLHRELAMPDWISRP
jgi:hypothetical protein